MWPLELTREIGTTVGAAKVVADKYGVSVSGVYGARKFVLREKNGEYYDETSRQWVRVTLEMIRANCVC
jgi:uncharacterized protein YdbL (DUF1318 family)